MPSTPNRRVFLATSLCLAAVAGSDRVSWADDPAADVTKNDNPSKSPRLFPFYVMDTGLRGPDVPTLEAKVSLAHDIGFCGIDYSYDPRQLPHLLDLLDKSQLELTAIYLSPFLEDKLDGGLEASIKLLKGRPTRIELALQSRKYHSSDVAGDIEGLDLVRRVADFAADSGPVVSLYPHRGAWTERVDDGVRLAEAARAAGCKNVGTNFNLVHWVWVKQTKPLDQTLKAALPYLYLVSINGLAGERIVSLDEGNYDLPGFLELLKNTGYRGRVGLQGFGVPGPSAEHLKRSMTKWRQMVKPLQT